MECLAFHRTWTSVKHEVFFWWIRKMLKYDQVCMEIFSQTLIIIRKHHNRRKYQLITGLETILSTNKKGKLHLLEVVFPLG